MSFFDDEDEEPPTAVRAARPQQQPRPQPRRPGRGGGSGGGSSGQTKGILHTLAADIGPGNAQSIPLPLLVLGGLALLLFLTAAATWFARRLQGRRITPAPAHAPASSVRPKP